MTEPKTKAQPVRPPRTSFMPSLQVEPSMELRGELPVERPANNMKGERLAPMTFNMPVPWHTEFKQTAAAVHVSMKELLVESFEAWKREQREKVRRG